MLLTPVILALWPSVAGPSLAKDPGFVDPQVDSVRLGDAASGKAFVLRFNGKGFEPSVSLWAFRYLNAGKTEVLDLIMFPGSVAYEFTWVALRRPRAAEPSATPIPGCKSFRSARGIHLGLSVEEVIALLGAPQKRTHQGTGQTLVYRCTSLTLCPILREVNMPEYEGNYVFRDGILVNCEWGYPYP